MGSTYHGECAAYALAASLQRTRCTRQPCGWRGQRATCMILVNLCRCNNITACYAQACIDLRAGASAPTADVYEGNTGGAVRQVALDSANPLVGQRVPWLSATCHLQPHDNCTHWLLPVRLWRLCWFHATGAEITWCLAAGEHPAVRAVQPSVRHPSVPDLPAAGERGEQRLVRCALPEPDHSSIVALARGRPSTVRGTLSA